LALFVTACSTGGVARYNSSYNLTARTLRRAGRRWSDAHAIGPGFANAVAGALVFAYSGSTYSQAQSFKDNMKLAAVYKKWAKAVA
jgi:hypothetical protein